MWHQIGRLSERCRRRYLMDRGGNRANFSNLPDGQRGTQDDSSVIRNPCRRLLLCAVRASQQVLGDADVKCAHGLVSDVCGLLQLGNGFVSQVSRRDRSEVSLGNRYGWSSRIRAYGVKLGARFDFDRFTPHQCETALSSNRVCLCGELVSRLIA